MDNQQINVENTNNSLDNGVNKKNGKNIIIIILIIVVSFFGGLFCGKMFNSTCSNEKSTDNEKDTSKSSINNSQEETYTFNKMKVESSDINPAESDELSKGIEINNVFFNPNYTDHGQRRPIYIHGKNNNSIMVSVKIIIEYYDKDNYRINKYTSDIEVYANSEFVASLDYILDDSQYETIKVSYTAEKLKSYETTIPIEKLEITHIKTSDNDIKVFVKNNSDMDGYFDIACIYYKDGKVVFVNNRTYLSLEHDETEEVSFLSMYLKKNPDYNTTERIEFDDYKVFVQSGYNTDIENY